MNLITFAKDDPKLMLRSMSIAFLFLFAHARDSSVINDFGFSPNSLL
jgi:hypothetical protein